MTLDNFCDRIDALNKAMPEDKRKDTMTPEEFYERAMAGDISPQDVKPKAATKDAAHDEVLKTLGLV